MSASFRESRRCSDNVMASHFVEVVCSPHSKDQSHLAEKTTQTTKRHSDLAEKQFWEGMVII